MQESVGFDFEHQPTSPIAPSRAEHATAVIVMGRRRTQYGEAPEAVITLEVGGRCIQSAPLEGLPECELVPTTKWRVCFLVRADVVAVASAYCTETRVKLVPHLGGGRDPHIRGKNRVQRPPKVLNAAAPSLRNPHSDRLASRVNAGIRAARPQRGNWCGANSPQCLLQHALNGSLIRLALPPAESGAIVVQHELHSALGHCAKTIGTGGTVKQRYTFVAVIQPIDIARATYSHFACNPSRVARA